MIISCISDTHGYLPEIPECDLFLHAGDICPATNHKISYQDYWLNYYFNPWLKSIKAKKKIVIPGNHDFIFDKNFTDEYYRHKYSLDCEILINETIEYEGLKIWGSPYTRKFFDWAFNMEPEELAVLHKQIPQCDIILTHGPPYGFGDLVWETDKDTKVKSLQHAGCSELMTKILEIEPKLVLFGHIHSGNSVHNLGDTIICNASYVNEAYKPTCLPYVFSVDRRTKCLDTH